MLVVSAGAVAVNVRNVHWPAGTAWAGWDVVEMSVPDALYQSKETRKSTQPAGEYTQ
jgi:predicted NUDIX family NTP pyrophosphohydrolase